MRSGFLDKACGTDEDLRYTVESLLAGQSLAAMIAAHPLTVEKAVLVAIGVAVEIDFLHGDGIVHGQIHPENIMVCPEGRVRLLHFETGARNPDRDIKALGSMLSEITSGMNAPKRLREIARKATRPQDRYAGAGDMQRDLENLLSQL